MKTGPKLGYKQSTEHVMARAQAMQGNTNGVGHVLSEETRRKMGDSRRGKPRTLEDRLAVSAGIRTSSKTWKGGRIIQDGYAFVRAPLDDPDARSNGYIAEHRVVMADMIGRRLLPNENPHHKNGVRDDNRPENLELWVVSQPKGQRVVDLVEWAHDILTLYGG